MQKIEIRLLVVAVQVSMPVTPEASGTPIDSTKCWAAPYSPAGSHSCHGRKVSEIRVAATRTMAMTVQLMMVP